MRMRRVAAIMASTAVATAATAAMAALASPASAATDRCSPGWSTNACTTATIRANAEIHAVHYTLKTQGRGCHFEVRDVDSRAVVRRGDLGAFDEKRAWIGGLYGRYRLELTSCGFGNLGWLSNTG